MSNCEDDKSVAGKPIEQPVRIEVLVSRSAGSVFELHPVTALRPPSNRLVVLLIVFIGTSYIYYRKSAGYPDSGGGRRDGGR